MRKITLLTLFVALFVFSALAQKAKVVNIQLKSGDQKGDYLGDSKAVGTTVFVVKIRKGQCFQAAAKIESNNSKMAGEFYTKNPDGSIDENSITQGVGSFSNQFGGCESERDQNFYFKITEKPSAKFSFRILVKNGRIN